MKQGKEYDTPIKGCLIPATNLCSSQSQSRMFSSAADPLFEVMVAMHVSPKACRMIRLARRLLALRI